MKRFSDRIVTPAGLSVGLAALALSGTVTGAAYFYRPDDIVVLVPGLLAAAAVLVTFLRAARQRLLRPGWWAVIVPVFLFGLLAGLLVAPFAMLDIEAGVFMALLIGPVALVVAVWIAVWTSVLVYRAGRHRLPHPLPDHENPTIVVTAS